MALRSRLSALNRAVSLKGDDTKHEQTDAWCNRDLIPLPPDRRTWGWFNYFGFWTITSLNLTVWQMVGAFLGTSLPSRIELLL